MDFNFNTTITAAAGIAPIVVLVLTELLKLVPVQFTSKYPAWVNLILSFVATLIVVRPSFTFSSLGAFVAVLLYICVVAAIAYNQFTSKLKGGNTTPPTA